MENQKIEIQTSKTKIVFSLIGSLTFVALGFMFLVFVPPLNQNGVLGDPALILAVGIITVLTFGFFSAMMLVKLMDDKPGMIISKDGILDNTGAGSASAGLIPWTEIREIKVANFLNQKFIMIAVADPDGFIGKESNALKRKAMKMNLKTYGAPIGISPNGLRIKYDELHKLLLEQMNIYKPSV